MEQGGVAIGAVAVGIWLVALIIMIVRTSASPGTPQNHEALVRGTPDEFLQRLAIAIGGLAKHTTASAGPQTVVIRRTYYARWRGVLAVLFFPIGLVALAGKDESTFTVVATQKSEDRTSLRMSGALTPQATTAINGVIDSLS